MIKKDQNEAIIQLFSHTENLTSSNMFSLFAATSKYTVCSCEILTDVCNESRLTVKKEHSH